MKRLLAALALLSLAACGGEKPPRAWTISDGEKVVLTVRDSPGPLVSAAAPPPGAEPVPHPFLSGESRSALHEDRLRKILEASQDADDFIRRVREAGFTVRQNEDR